MKRLLLVLVLILAVLVSAPMLADDHPGCMKAKGVQRTVANLDNGVRITVTCSDPNLVAEVQARVAKGCGGECPMSARGVTRAVENTADGAVVTATSSDPALVKALQEHAAKGCSHEGHGTTCKHGKAAKEKAAGHTCPHNHGEGAAGS